MRTISRYKTMPDIAAITIWGSSPRWIFFFFLRTLLDCCNVFNTKFLTDTMNAWIAQYSSVGFSACSIVKTSCRKQAHYKSSSLILRISVRKKKYKNIQKGMFKLIFQSQHCVMLNSWFNCDLCITLHTIYKESVAHLQLYEASRTDDLSHVFIYWPVYMQHLSFPRHCYLIYQKAKLYEIKLEPYFDKK